ncbi:translocase of chloroplast 120, chloroplastic-like protein [Cinnamomum micranthum f. kanehirae]|uniref:Translocase of chloroplast 120, chloroplastic-like protein n=1 Tax=Cinnamomum micranthum f. kanehirae TaxID=337451 RepID=A0A3S3Q959_9MAGN|nr:translocase of chloroplast 120, chloroplastic-like protein [Cinnamomum micranthum f. kanehirae]
MENGVGAVLESRAVENDDQKLGFGDGDARNLRGLKDSEADGVLEEAVVGGDEKVGRSREIDGIGNSLDGVEIKRSEEAMDHSLGNGDFVLDPLVERGDPEGEGVVVLTASTAAVENGEKVEGVGSLEASTAAVENGEKEERVGSLEASTAAVENGEKEEGVGSLEASSAAVENGEKEEGVGSLEASTAAVENGEKEEGVGSLEASTAAVENDEKEEGVGSLEAYTAAVENGGKEEGVGSLEASTAAVENGEKEEGVPLEASAAENGEKEKYENRGMDSGAIHAIGPEMGEANEGIEDDGKANDNHMPGKSEDGVDAVEEKMEDNAVLGHPIDDDGVCNGMDDAENSEISRMAELNGVAGHEDGYAVSGASVVVDGKEELVEKSENGVFVVDEKSENGSCDEANSEEVCSSVCEKPENGETDEVNLGEIDTLIHEKPSNGVFDVVHCGEFGEQIQHQDESAGMEDSSSNKNALMEKEVSAVDEESENGNHDEANSGEICAGVHEKSDDDDNDEANVGKIHSLIHQKPGNGVYYEVPSGELSEQIQHQKGSPEKVDTSDIADASVDEKLEASQGKSQPLVGVLTELNEEKGAEPDECEAKDWQDSQAQLSGDTQNGCSDHSEVLIRTKELSETEDIRKQDSEPSCAEKSAPRKLLEREIISVEEYDASNSTDEDDTVPGIQRASVVSGSSGNSADPPAPPRPAGLGSSASVLEPIPRVLQQPRVNGAAPQRQSQLMEDPINGETEEYDETREKLQMIRVKFLRLARRLGQTPHNVVVAQVLYRLGLAEQLRGSRNATRAGAFSFDRASAMAEQLEAASQEPLDFSCTIMVIGKTGVGKSATINSIFDEVKFSTDAFQLGTKKVQDIVGMVQGIKVRVIDTPGLLSSCLDQHQNKKILNSVKNFIKKTPPDIVLYLDRLDMQSRDFGDVPLLRTITDIFGPSIWFNAIVVLTHAASAPPDGPNGTPLSYEMFVTQRSHVVQQAIRQAAGDMRLMNPVSLVENHSACRTNRAGQRVLPNGQVWKPHLLLLSFASKILAEANTLLKLQDSPPGKPFGTRSKIPPLPFLLSSLLQSRPPA